MRTYLLPLLGLVLGVSVATAAPVSSQKAAKAKKVVVGPGYPVMSSKISATCRDCLAGAACTPATKATCKAEVEGVLEDHWNATKKAPTVTVMKLGGTEMPRDLRQAKYFKDTRPRSTFTSILWPKAKIEAVPVDRLGKVSASTAANAHRQPQWDTNGEKIATCDEYAYEEMYDVMRFLDASNACRGDRECVMDVAFMPNTPGIAERTLNRRDGTPLTPHGPFPNQLRLDGAGPLGGKAPKNEMFQLGAKYLYANGKADRRPALPKNAELEAWLTEGQKFYTISSTGEWDWHALMRTRTKDVTDAEREEYERRLAKFRELTAQHAAAVAAFENSVAQLTEPKEHEIVLPYDMQTSDIFERYDRVQDIREYVQRVRTRLDKGIKKGTIPKTVTQPVTPQQHHQNGGLHQHQITARASSPTTTPPVAVLGYAPPKPQATSSTGPTPKTTKKSPSVKKAKSGVSPCFGGSDEDWGLEAWGEGRISCRIGEFLREEWARKKAGYKSCLDRDNYGCDWRPETFSSRVLSKISDIDKYDVFVTRCKAWTNGTFNPPAKDVDDAKAIIDQAEKDIGAARKALEPYYQGTNDHGRKYSGEWGESKVYGDKDWFGASLAFEAGWDVAAAAKTGDNGNVCSLSGGLKGKVDATAHFALFDASLVKGDIYAEVNKSGGPGQARFRSKLAILGDQVYKKPSGSGWVTSQIVEEGPLAFDGTPKATFQVVIAGVPVTGSLWGEMGLGYALSAKGTAPTGCDVNDTSFAVKGGFGPVLSAVGRASVGVGIAGIVSAGITAAVTIVRIDLPLTVGMKMKAGSDPKIVFGTSLDLLLATLSGRMSLYIEFLLFSEEWELFRWNGIGPARAHLMPKLTAELPLSGMRP